MQATERRELHALLPDRAAALILDFDGVPTDNRVLVTADGHEAVFCSRGAGLGLGILQAAGIKLLLLSKKRNPVVSRRAEKLRIECLQAVDDKPTALRRWAAEHGLALARAIFVGTTSTTSVAWPSSASPPAPPTRIRARSPPLDSSSRKTAAKARSARFAICSFSTTNRCETPNPARCHYLLL